MFKILFLMFLIVPIVEIAFLIQLSDVIGGGATILLVLVTAYMGAKLVKSQGLAAFHNIQQQSQGGKSPAEELFNGVCILIAGVLLLTPGIFTDVIGFLLLTPPFRAWLGVKLVKKMMSNVMAGNGSFVFTSSSASSSFREGQTFDHSSFHQSTFNQSPFNQNSFDAEEHKVGQQSFEPANSYERNKNASRGPQPQSNDIIDGEFERKD